MSIRIAGFSDPKKFNQDYHITYQHARLTIALQPVRDRQWKHLALFFTCIFSFYKDMNKAFSLV